MTIAEKLLAYHGVRHEQDRERSWEICHSYFHTHGPEGIRADRDHAALHLGFYLASWGMYRPSSFLFQYAYTVHLGVVDCLTQPKFSTLWSQEFGGGENDKSLVPVILDACQELRSAYLRFGEATDTLVTKVLLGTLGCLPATDENFTRGYRHLGFSFPAPLNSKFIQAVMSFCRNNLLELQGQQTRIEQAYGLSYPLMKLVDMYFHQTGLEINAATSSKRAPSPNLMT
jgi:hypothetical protein